MAQWRCIMVLAIIADIGRSNEYNSLEECRIKHIKIGTETYSPSVLKTFKADYAPSTVRFAPNENYYYVMNNETKSITGEPVEKTFTRNIVSITAKGHVSMEFNQQSSAYKYNRNSKFVYITHKNLVYGIKMSSKNYGPLYVISNDVVMFGAVVASHHISHFGKKVYDVDVDPSSGNILLSLVRKEGKNLHGQILLLKKEKKDPCLDITCTYTTSKQNNLNLRMIGIRSTVADLYEKVITTKPCEYDALLNVLQTYNDNLVNDIETYILNQKTKRRNVPNRGKRSVNETYSCFSQEDYESQEDLIDSALAYIDVIDKVIYESQEAIDPRSTFM